MESSFDSSGPLAFKKGAAQFWSLEAVLPKHDHWSNSCQSIRFPRLSGLASVSLRRGGALLFQHPRDRSGAGRCDEKWPEDL